MHYSEKARGRDADDWKLSHMHTDREQHSENILRGVEHPLFVPYSCVQPVLRGKMDGEAIYRKSHFRLSCRKMERTCPLRLLLLMLMHNAYRYDCVHISIKCFKGLIDRTFCAVSLECK